MAETNAAVLTRQDTLPIKSIDRAGGGAPPPEPPPSPDQVTLRITTLPKTPLEFRNAIGMPEEVVNPEALFESKKQKVEEYVDQNNTKAPRNWFAGGEQNTTFHDGKISTQLADQKISTRIWRGVMKKRLGWMGIEDPNALLQTIEGNVLIHERKDFKPDVLVKLIKTLDPENEQEALRKLGLAFQRASSFYEFSRSSQFQHSPDKLIDQLNVFGSVSEEKWQEIYHQFDGRTEAIRNNGFFTIDKGLTEVVRHGGLTKEQMELLDKAVVWTRFAHALPFSKSPDDHQAESWLEYEDLFDPKVGAQIEKYHPALINWVADILPLILANKTKSYPRHRIADGRSFIAGIKHIEDTGKAGHLKMLIDSGWNVEGIFKQIDGVGYGSLPSPESFEELDETLTNIVNFNSDTDKAGWARAISEYFYKQKELKVSGVPVYEELVQNKDTLISLALILNTLPKQEGISPNALYDTDKGEVKIDVRELNRYIEKALEEANISEFDKQYVTGLRRLVVQEIKGDQHSGKTEYLTPELLNFYTYIAMNKNTVTPELFNGFGSLDVHSKFLNDLNSLGIPISDEMMKKLILSCRDQELLSPILIFNHYDDLNSGGAQLLANLPDNFIKTLPLDQQSQLMFIRGLPENLRERFSNINKDDFSKYIDNGQPTAAFAAKVLNAGFFNEARGLFTDQLLSTFSVEDREFFTTCLNLAPDVLIFMRAREAGWKQYFKDGQPTSDFLAMIASSGGGEKVIFGILSKAEMSTFSLKDKLFWEFYRDSGKNPAIRDYLFKNAFFSNTADRFSTLIVDGKPTAAFLTEVSSTGSIDLNAIREVLSQINIEDLPVADQDF